MKEVKSWIWLLVLVLACTAGCRNGLNPGQDESLPCPIPRELIESPPGSAVNFRIQNNACNTICAVNISPRGCDDWGVDWLGDRNIYSGGDHNFRVVPGAYDLLVETCTEDTFIWNKVSIQEDHAVEISDTEPANPAACPASITVVNNSDQPICYLWIANQGAESFGLNWLGKDQIVLGETRTFNIPADTYDLKAEDCEFNILGLSLDQDIYSPIEWVVP